MTFDRKKYKSFALMQLKGRWKPAVFATIISLVILTLFSLTQTQSSSYTFSQLLTASVDDLLNSPILPSGRDTILSIIQTIMDFVIDIVLYSFFLIFTRSPDPVSLNSYFAGYNKWGRGILCGLWRVLWLFLWALLAIPLLIIFTIIITLTQIDITEDSTLLTVLSLIILLVGFIPMFIKSIEYSFATIFAAEFPDVGIRKALRLSITITKGHRWELFVLELSFLGWFLFGFVTFCIGFFWVLPYYHLTQINAYHALLQDALENGKVKPEDLN